VTWAAHAQPGDEISFMGPGGAWAPAVDADVHLLVGDEAAIPAIAVALEALPADARALVFVEVASADHHQPLRRFLFFDTGLDRSRVSISGHWRTGLNEDGWQSSKREFNAAMEAEDPQGA